MEVVDIIEGIEGKKYAKKRGFFEKRENSA